MYNICDILGMPIISLFDGATEGIIKNAIFSKDLKKVNGFLVLKNLEGENEITFLPAKDIMCIGQDALVVKFSQCLLNTNCQENSPVNASAFNSEGKFLGIVSNIIIDKNYKVISFNFLGGGSKERAELFSYNNCTLVFNETGKPIKKVRSKTLNQKPVTVSEPENLVAETQPPVITAEPDKKISNYNFILGRHATRDIYSFNNELLVKAGSVITPQIVNLVRIYGKLRELTTYS